MITQRLTSYSCIVLFPKLSPPTVFFFFFFNDPAPPEIYPFPLPAALPIPGEGGEHHARRGGTGPNESRTLLGRGRCGFHRLVLLAMLFQPVTQLARQRTRRAKAVLGILDRKSTRLNSSHLVISYAVFCLKK